MAAGGGYSSGPGMHEVLLLVNLAVLVGVVYVAGRKGIMESLKTRSEDIRKKLFESKEQLKIVNENMAQVKSQLDDFEKTKAQMLDDMKKEAEHVRAKILEEASLSATKILDDAKLAAKNEVRGAASDLKQDLIDETLLETQKLLNSDASKKSAVHDKLLNDLTSQIEGARS